LGPQTLLERLREPRFRRLYGWPWWDGHQWSFSPDALDPARRAQHLSMLPDLEPTAHVAMLPPWCERKPITPECPAGPDNAVCPSRQALYRKIPQLCADQPLQPVNIVRHIRDIRPLRFQNFVPR
jgi:hypothetical protein